MKSFEVFARDERTIRLKEQFFQRAGFVTLPAVQTDTGDWRMNVWKVAT